MGLVSRIVQHDEFIEDILSGSYCLQESIDEFLKIVTACRQSGLVKVVIDCRKIEGNAEATEKALYILEIEDIYGKHLDSGGCELMIAYVVGGSFASIFEPGLNMARRNHLLFDLFADTEKACEWLGVCPA